MAVIPLRVHRMKKKLEKMQLKERLITDTEESF